MRTWMRYALVVAAPLVMAGAIGFRLAGGPQAPPKLVHAVLFGPNVGAMRRLEAKARTARDVIAGRLSLLEAAAVFKARDAEGPPYPGWILLDCRPGASEDETYCRNVIAWVGATALSNQADDLTYSLQAELDARLRDGTLRLPASPPVVALPEDQDALEPASNMAPAGAFLQIR